ncbi:hypothetical protein DUZ99_10585 [Xylanibacillus composti]|nr:hypothetical protein [Xylanibacillus composti]
MNINARRVETTYVQQLVTVLFVWILIVLCKRNKFGFSFFYGKVLNRGSVSQKWVLLGSVFVGNTLCFVPFYMFHVEDKPEYMQVVIFIYAILTAGILIYFYRYEKQKYLQSRQAYLTKK